MCKNCCESESFSPCPPLNARLLHGEEIMCGEWRWRWRWDGDAETARVVSVTRLVSTHCRVRCRYSGLCKSTVKSSQYRTKPDTCRFRHPPRPTIQAEKTPNEKPIHSERKHGMRASPDSFWRCGFFSMPRYKHDQDFTRFLQALRRIGRCLGRACAVPVLLMPSAKMDVVKTSTAS